MLEAAGFRVCLPDQELCCGLTWISTGQLAVASRVLRRTAAAMAPTLEQGIPVVGLEPICTAVFRSDGPELLPGDDDVRRLADSTRTLAELLAERAPQWSPGQAGRSAVVQQHCHQHAVLGFERDREAMARAGLSADVLDSGCCGLAGNFGFEPGHLDVSMACAEQVLLPAVRDADAATVVVADGFSCRTQIEHGSTGRRAVHLAEALAEVLDGVRAAPIPRTPWRPDPARQDGSHRHRRSPPSALAAVGAPAGLAAVAGAAALRRTRLTHHT